MDPIAHVKEIWRYPVKSMGGEQQNSASLTETGMVGDRLWAVLDADGEIKSARQWSKLIQMAARYADSEKPHANAYVESVPNVVISAPGQAEFASRAPNTNSELGQFLQKDCRLEPLRPAAATEFFTPPKERNVANLDVELDKLEGEGDFDFSQTPEEIFEILGQYMTPTGAFYDTFPLHILSTQSLNYLARESKADANQKRFRPNILLDFVDGSADTPEFTLAGKLIRIGATAIRIRAKTIRCSIPSRPQPLLGLEQDPAMTRAMVDLFERHIGVYASIEAEGDIKIGDPVFVGI